MANCEFDGQDTAARLKKLKAANDQDGFHELVRSKEVCCSTCKTACCEALAT